MPLDGPSASRAEYCASLASFEDAKGSQMEYDAAVEVTPEERRAAAVLFAALEPFRKARKRMPLSLITTFMNVAIEEGLTVTELAKRCGMNGSVISKHLRDLGTVNRRQGPGLELIAVVQQVHGDHRERRVILTERGGTLARKVVNAMKGGRQVHENPKAKAKSVR